MPSSPSMTTSIDWLTVSLAIEGFRVVTSPRKGDQLWCTPPESSHGTRLACKLHSAAATCTWLCLVGGSLRFPRACTLAAPLCQSTLRERGAAVTNRATDAKIDAAVRRARALRAARGRPHARARALGARQGGGGGAAAHFERERLAAEPATRPSAPAATPRGGAEGAARAAGGGERETLASALAAARRAARRTRRRRWE